MFRKKLKCSLESIGREEITAWVMLVIINLGRYVIKNPTTMLLAKVPVMLTAIEKQAATNSMEIKLAKADKIHLENTNAELLSIRLQIAERIELPKVMIPSQAATEANRLKKMVSL